MSRDCYKEPRYGDDFLPETLYQEHDSASEKVWGVQGFRDEVGIRIREAGSYGPSDGYNVFVSVPSFSTAFTNEGQLNHDTLREAFEGGAKTLVAELNKVIDGFISIRDAWQARLDDQASWPSEPGNQEAQSTNKTEQEDDGLSFLDL